ncbi:MAG: hypothetical protein ABUS48_03400 [Pseudomonadota bacterium]
MQRRHWVLVCVALAVGGCSPAAEGPKQSAAAVNGCPAHAAAVWRAGENAFAVIGDTTGADCAHATATLSIRDGSQAVVYTASAPVADLMTLSSAKDAAAMQTALVQWIDPATAASTTNDLPEWSANAENPIRGEFPFYPEERIDRAVYSGIRAADAPMYCYVQGMESQACIAWTNGQMTKLGVQTFPG